MSFVPGRSNFRPELDEFEPAPAFDTKARDRLATYGLTPAEYVDMVRRQDGRCAICDREGLELVIDHDHAEGGVRGLLCRRCNTTLGWLRDEPELADRMAEYLRHHTLVTRVEVG